MSPLKESHNELNMSNTLACESKEINMARSPRVKAINAPSFVTPPDSEEQNCDFRHAAMNVKQNLSTATGTIDTSDLEEPLHLERGAKIRIGALSEFASPWASELKATFETCRMSCSDSFLLLSGPKGVGKTRLAFSTLAPLVEDSGYFISGKFDRLSHARPYSAFVMALSEFTAKVLERGPEEVRIVHQAFESAVGSEKNVLCSMIPDLEKILGDHQQNKEAESVQAPRAVPRDVQATDTKTNQTAIKFNFALRCSLRAICSKDRPLVLFLDNLQYADTCSLDVLYSLAMDQQTEGLILVAACDDTVTPDCYFASKLRDMEDQIKILNFSLNNFDQGHVYRMIKETIAMEGDGEVTALSRVVFDLTQGNMLYTVEFLRWLQECDVLRLDNYASKWTFDQCKLHDLNVPSSCRDMMVDRIIKLPQHYQDVLKVASCLGSKINEDLLQYVVDFDVYPILCDLFNQGFLSLHPSGTFYVFHDGLLTAAYELVSDTQHEREHLHLEIARRIWRKLSTEGLEKHLFILLSQFAMGKNLIHHDQEKVSIAILCLHAGEKAAKASSFRVAAFHLELGISLLSKHPQSWRAHYDLMLALHNAAGEMHMCTGNVEDMETLLRNVLKYSRTEYDRIQSYRTRICSMSYGERQGEAVDLAVEVLKGLGETFPTRNCASRMIAEYKSVKKLLHGKSDEQLLRIPFMTDKTKLQCLQILNVMILPSMMQRPRFTPFVLLKGMKISLEHGLSVFASSSFATYGVLCIAAVNDCNEANRFAALSLILLDRFKSVEYLPRVYAAVYGIIQPWSCPARKVLYPLMKAHRVGLETGDLEFSSLSSILYCIYGMDTGLPLQDIVREYKGFKESMTLNRQETFLSASMPHIQAFHHLMGLTDDPLSSKGDILDYDEFYAEASEKGSLMSVIGVKFCRTMIHYYFNDYEGALRFCPSMCELWSAPPTFERSTGFLFSSLSRLGVARMGKDARKHLREARKVLKLMETWARQCPENFMDKVFLLEAEIASLRKKNKLAYEKYICASSLAETNKLPQIAALSRELLGRHLVSTGKHLEARPHFKKACELYEEWGAFAKVQQLRKYMESIGAKFLG